MEKKKQTKTSLPIKWGRIKDFETAQADLMQCANEHRNSAIKIQQAMVLIAPKEIKLLDVGIEIHNLSNATRSLNVYFEMMKMLAEGIKSDIESIKKKRKAYGERLQAIKDAEKAAKKQTPKKMNEL